MRSSFLTAPLVLSACITFEPTRAVEPIGPTAPTEVAGKLGIGAACTSGDECTFGFCVDGVCCGSACGGGGARCDDPAGPPGVCTPVPAGAVSPQHEPCVTATASCAGICDGTSEACVYPGVAIHCGADCQGTCNAAGACSTAGSCPNNFSCVGATCATGCASDLECVQFFRCVNNQCVRRPEADCLDGADDNGDTLKDCADPSCAALVECVVDPGAELGFVGDTCTSDYPASGTLHQGAGPNVGTVCAHDCACTTGPAECDVPLTFFGAEGTGSTDHLCSSNSYDLRAAIVRSDMNNNMCAYSHSLGFEGVNCLGDTPPGIRPHSILIGTPHSPQTIGPSTVSGTATPPAATWTVTTSFCKAARKSSTCSPGMSCVTKRTGPRCIRVSGTATCGGAFAIQEQWFAGFGTDTRTCSTCSMQTRTDSPRTCPTSVHFMEDTTPDTCDLGSQGHPVANTAGLRYPNHPTSPGCNNNGPAALSACNSDGCYFTFCSLMVSSSSGWGASNCALTSTPTITSGAIAGSGPSTTCCTP